MDNSRKARFIRANKKALNKSASETKHCYMIGCEQPVIRAHSISNTRLLLRLSDNGEVMYFDKGSPNAGQLTKTGRGSATTFGGFCGEHDKIFHPIDNEDYVVNNAEQEYLFALRASAKEFNTRKTVGNLIDAHILKNVDPEFTLDAEGEEMMRLYKQGFSVGTDDLIRIRGIFVDTQKNGKHNVILTTALTVDEELPIAVSSAFNPELAPDGTILNDVSPEGWGTTVKPWFFTVFPQAGKTYCLISYFRRDRRAFAFLDDIANSTEDEKKVAISNLIASYTENFVANPTYWNSLSAETQAKYIAVFGNSFKTEHAPFIADDRLNLFPSRP